MIIQNPLKPYNSKQRAAPPIEKSRVQKNGFKGLLKPEYIRKEGIQKGIPVFEGLSLKEIFFIARNLDTVALQRGCRNLCSHCYVDAPAPSKIPKDHLQDMAFEDLESLTDGAKELSERLKENIFKHKKPKYYNDVALFIDGDPMFTRLPDKNGKHHGIAEATKKIFDAFENPILTDTAGWNAHDAKTQKAAQELNEYLAQNVAAMGYDAVNISINPFHSILEKANELKTHSKQASQELQNAYVKRCANALETFLGCGSMPFIRVAETSEHNAKTQKKLNYEIWKTLKDNLRKKDLSDKEQTHLAKIERQFLAFERGERDYIGPLGRGARFFDPQYKKLERREIEEQLEFKHQKHPNDFLRAFWDDEKTIDANGKVYARDSRKCIDTGLQLNFKNKDKQTPHIYSLLDEAPIRYFHVQGEGGWRVEKK